MTATARQVLKALRSAGLTARSGCAPIKTDVADHPQCEVLSGKVINFNDYGVLGYGCWNHPDYNAVHDAMAARVSAALTAAGVAHVRAPGGHGRVSSQFYINGYKA